MPNKRSSLFVAVLDTNTLLSGYRSRGNPFSPTGQIFEAALEGRFLLVASDRALYELSEKVQETLPVTLEEALLFVEQIAKLSRVVRILGLDYRVRDERDNLWVETAYNARADYIVTRDRDLLDDRLNGEYLAKHGVSIISPEKFLQAIKRAVSPGATSELSSIRELGIYGGCGSIAEDFDTFIPPDFKEYS